MADDHVVADEQKYMHGNLSGRRWGELWSQKIHLPNSFMKLNENKGNLSAKMMWKNK